MKFNTYSCRNCKITTKTVWKIKNCPNCKEQYVEYDLLENKQKLEKFIKYYRNNPIAFIEKFYNIKLLECQKLLLKKILRR